MSFLGKIFKKEEPVERPIHEVLTDNYLKQVRLETIANSLENIMVNYVDDCDQAYDLASHLYNHSINTYLETPYLNESAKKIDLSNQSIRLQRFVKNIIEEQEADIESENYDPFQADRSTGLDFFEITDKFEYLLSGIKDPNNKLKLQLAIIDSLVQEMSLDEM